MGQSNKFVSYLHGLDAYMGQSTKLVSYPHGLVTYMVESPTWDNYPNGTVTHIKQSVTLDSHSYVEISKRVARSYILKYISQNIEHGCIYSQVACIQ